MRPSFLGKILLRWCDTCHTPVLSKTCSTCGSATREVPLTPPGDARPAFPSDIDLINTIFEDHFGSPLISPGQLVLYDNVEEVREKYGAQVVRTSTTEKFYSTLERQGPPAVNSRWCCSVCKLLPVAETIRSSWGECLSFIGQRRYESLSRAESDRIWRNPTVKVQVSAAPIHNWTALHVWLYLFKEQAPYNKLYERRLDRIGCFMCPSSDMALIHMIETDFSDLWEGWLKHLENYRLAHNLPADWIKSGAWRIRENYHGKEYYHY